MKNINWFPGHMKKTAEIIINNLNLVDIVIELIDARIPISSSNPTISQLTQGKSRVIALGKSDLVESSDISNYISGLDQDIKVVPINAVNGDGIDKLRSAISEKTKFVSDKMARQGRKMRSIRAMVVGNPNVGKSTLINRLAGKNIAKTGNKPGVTRGKQWIKIDKNIDLFDTPGILWPKFENEQIGIKLAITGAIRDEIISSGELAVALLELIKDIAPNALFERYGIPESSFGDFEFLHELLFLIGKKRGALIKGGDVDYDKAGKILIEDYRMGKLGKICLDRNLLSRI